MKRSVIKVLADVSLLFCGVAVVLSTLLLIAGVWRFDHLMLEARHGTGDWLIQVVSSRGGLGIDAAHWWELDPSEGSMHFSRDRQPLAIYPDYGGPGTPTINWYFMGFQLRHDNHIGSNTNSIVVPEPVFLLLGVPIIHRLLLRRRSKSPNLCQVCGYDLRATPDRCPECGIIPSKNISSQTDRPPGGGSI